MIRAPFECDYCGSKCCSCIKPKTPTTHTHDSGYHELPEVEVLYLLPANFNEYVWIKLADGRYRGLPNNKNDPALTVHYDKRIEPYIFKP